MEITGRAPAGVNAALSGPESIGRLIFIMALHLKQGKLYASMKPGNQCHPENRPAASSHLAADVADFKTSYPGNRFQHLSPDDSKD
jgi:hypothetical protein